MIPGPAAASGAAHYARVKQFVIDRVASGALKPADRVPSENELARKFGISRMTVNRALRELLAEGRDHADCRCGQLRGRSARSCSSARGAQHRG